MLPPALAAGCMPLALLVAKTKTKALQSKAALMVELRPKRRAPKPHAEAPAVPSKRAPKPTPCAKKGEQLKSKRMPRPKPPPKAEAPHRIQALEPGLPWLPWAHIQGPPPKADAAPAGAHAKAHAHAHPHAKPRTRPRPRPPNAEPPSRGRRRARTGPRIPDGLQSYRRFRDGLMAELKKQEGRRAKDKREAKMAKAWLEALEVKAEPDSEAEAEPIAEPIAEPEADAEPIAEADAEPN